MTQVEEKPSERPAGFRRGEVIDRYEVVDRIGVGGMAAVYAVRLSSIAGFSKLLAMKVLHPHLRTSRQFIDMFLDEARIASNISHPNVVQVFDLGEHNGYPFIVMELLRGKSLRQIANRVRDLSLGFRIHVLAMAAEGLHAAHEAKDAEGHPLNIVHRDVSPHNIHVGYAGSVKIVDFGIAAARGRLAETSTGEVKGKFSYLAPEQVERGRDVDRRADIWALGVIAWQLATGRRLFQRESPARQMWAILHEDIEDPKLHNPQLSDEASSLILSCLRRNPDARPQDCAAVAEGLHAEARSLSEDTRSDVVRTMEEFQAEREEQTRRFAEFTPSKKEFTPSKKSAIISPESVAEHATRSQTISDAHTDPEAKSQRSRAWVIALAVLSLGLGADALRRHVHWPQSADEPQGNAPAATPTMSASSDAVPALHKPAESQQPVTVHVDARAKLVLIDGKRSDQRPLRLSLKPDELAAVELVSPTGEITRHSVGVAADGTKLMVAGSPPETRQPAQRRRRPRRGVRKADSARGTSEEPKTSNDQAAPEDQTPADDQKTLMRNPYL